MARIELPADFLALPVERAARIGALALLRSATRARERLTDSDSLDEDALHDFRVAVRRFRSWLQVYRSALEGSVSRKARRRLRAVVRATGTARDLEVELAWLRPEAEALDVEQRHAIAELRGRRERSRVDADQAVRRAVARDFRRAAARLEKSLAVYTVTVRVDEDVAPLRPMALAAADGIRRITETLRSRLDELRASTEPAAADQPTLHRARVAAKRLRYVLEPLAAYVASVEPVLERLTHLQDAIGQMLDTRLLVRAVVAEGALATLTADSRAALMTFVPGLQKRESTAFAVLVRDWLGDTTSDVFDAADAIAVELASRASGDERVAAHANIPFATPARSPGRSARRRTSSDAATRADPDTKPASGSA